MFEFPFASPKIEEHVQITEQKIEIGRFTVFIDKEIAEPSDYRNLITLLMNASPLDQVDLIINSPGGQLYTCNAIVQAIINSAANVRAVIMGECASAASVIALNCDDWLVMESAEMMIHTASFGACGNSKNVKDHVDFTIRKIERLMDSSYAGFLSKKEITDVKNGIEIHLDDVEITERLNRVKRKPKDM